MGGVRKYDASLLFAKLAGEETDRLNTQSFSQTERAYYTKREEQREA